MIERFREPGSGLVEKSKVLLRVIVAAGFLESGKVFGHPVKALNHLQRSRPNRSGAGGYRHQLMAGFLAASAE